MSETNMHDLAARLARGEEAAYAELYDACVDRLYHWLTVRLGSRDAAADVLQSAFLRAVKGRRRFRKVENPVAYLFQIARNEAARAIAKERRRPKHAERGDHLTIEAADKVVPIDEAEAAAAALDKLADDDRELVELKIYGGLTFREIAAVTGQPQGTVATRYRRAVESLRGWLTKQMR
jgi:RNA polymerase sigma-70 factor (ECF subfamily)